MTFLDDAEQRTESWKLRHSPEAVAQLGVWRWKGIQQHAGTILDLICGKRVIDFGGYDAPLGFGSIVVDEKAEHKSLSDVGGPVDVIFTSHTLEHLDNPAEWLRDAHEKLNEGGFLIVHVPAWTCKRWRAEQYDNPNQTNGHKWTFAITGSDAVGVTGWTTRIDALLFGFVIELAEYVGDNSILVIARKQ